MRRPLLRALRLFSVGWLAMLPLMSAGPARANAGSAKPPPTLRIGVLIAQSGEASEYSSTAIRGVRMAVKHLNDGPLVLGRQLELLVFDGAGTTIGARMAAERAVAAGVIAIIGPPHSDGALAAAPAAQAAGIPMVTPSATHPDVTRVGDCVFRICFTDAFQAEALAAFALTDLKVRRAATLTNVRSHESMVLSRFFGERFAAGGGVIVRQLSYKPEAADFADLLGEAVADGVQMLFLPGRQESGRIVRKAMEMGIDLPIMGGAGWDRTDFFRNGGRDVARGYYAAHWRKNTGGEAYRYLIKYHPPQLVITSLALGYDAMMLLGDAIGRAGTATPDAVRGALARTVGFPGITGEITMPASGDPPKPVHIYKIENGRDLYVKTFRPKGEAHEAPPEPEAHPEPEAPPEHKDPA